MYEQEEILSYAELWFLGLEAKKIEGLPETQNNNCYDDEHGTYIKVRGKIMGLVFWATIFAVTFCPLLTGLCEKKMVSAQQLAVNVHIANPALLTTCLNLRREALNGDPPSLDTRHVSWGLVPLLQPLSTSPGGIRLQVLPVQHLS